MNEIKIDGNKYKYFLKRDSVYKFTKILGKLDINIKPEEIKDLSDLVMMVKLIQNALFNFETTDKESMDFITSIYGIEAKEVEEKEFHKFELKLWENLFQDKELVSFFSRAFKSKIQELQKKKT